MAEFLEFFRQCWHLIYWFVNTFIDYLAGSIQILVLGISLTTSLKHHEVCSFTFFLIPAATYRLGASFSFMRLQRERDRLAFVLLRCQPLLPSELGDPSSQGLRNSQNTVVVGFPLWVPQAGPGVFLRVSLWVWKLKTLLGPRADCAWVWTGL